MDINIYRLELEKFFQPNSLDTIIYILRKQNQDHTIRLHVFYNAMKTYTFSVTSCDMQRVVYDTLVFQDVCKTSNIGIIKDIIVVFQQYIRSCGYKGNVEIAQILDTKYLCS